MSRTMRARIDRLLRREVKSKALIKFHDTIKRQTPLIVPLVETVASLSTGNPVGVAVGICKTGREVIARTRTNTDESRDRRRIERVNARLKEATKKYQPLYDRVQRIHNHKQLLGDIRSLVEGNPVPLCLRTAKAGHRLLLRLDRRRIDSKEIHEQLSGLCGELTLDDDRCTRRVKDGGPCWQHR